MVNLNSVVRKLISKSPAVVRKMAHGISLKSPEILTSVGVVGVISTAYLASRAGSASDKAIKRMKADRQVAYENKEVETAEVSNKEVIKTAVPFYIPTFVSGALTITCIVFSNRLSSARQKAMAGIYTTAIAALKEREEKYMSKLSEEDRESVKKDIAREVMKNAPDIDSVPIPGHGNQLCFDVLSGRFFYSSLNEVEDTVNRINKRIISDMWVTLNEFYYELGLDPIILGEDLGWNVDHLLEIRDSDSGIEPKTRQSYIIIEYPIRPLRGCGY